jgi:hypothetical protein
VPPGVGAAVVAALDEGGETDGAVDGDVEEAGTDDVLLAPPLPPHAAATTSSAPTMPT